MNYFELHCKNYCYGNLTNPQFITFLKKQKCKYSIVILTLFALSKTHQLCLLNYRLTYKLGIKYKRIMNDACEIRHII